MLTFDENNNIKEIRGYLYDQTHQKEMEFKLIEERKRLDEIIKGTHIGTWEWNVQTGETFFNERWAEIIGYSLEELTPTTIETWTNFEHKEDGKKSAKLLEEHFKGEKAYYECEVRMKHKNGHWIWVLDRGRVSEWTEDKKPLWVFGTHQDITERKLYEEKLRNSKIMLETVMNSIPQFIFWKDTNSVYLGCNENGRKLAGLENAEDIIGKTDYDLPWRNTDADDFVREDKMIIKTKTANKHSVEYRVYNQDETWIDKNKIPLFDSNGEVNGILVTFEDISERVKTEQNLKISEKRYRGLIESQNDLIIRVDTLGKFTFVNEVYCKTFGRSKEELLEKYFSPLIHKDDIEDTLIKMENLKTPPYRAYIVQRANTINGWRWLAWEYSSIKDDNGNIVEIQGVGRDITDLKEAQLKAEDASKAKSEFLANMSHEIRTPLNSVIGFSELLLDVEDIKPQYKSYINYINKSAGSLLEIINDILDMSKIEAGKLELNYTEVDLVDILEEIMDIIKINIAKKDIELLLNIENELPKVIEVDSIRLKQILLNLLGNSTKFTEKGEIELKVLFVPKNAKTGSIYFEVRDTGIGIPKANEEKLFKAFSQGDTSITRKFGGTGLGLVISSMLISKMGGNLKLKSKEGIGSKFYFEIKVNYSNIKEKQYNLSEEIKNALIIDDNYNNRLILKQYLEKWGIKSKEASGGNEALELLKTGENFDLLIVDYNMPYMNGVEVIKNIEKINNHIVLLYSSEIESIQHPKIDLKLSKPVKEKDLYNFLLTAVKKHNKKEEIHHSKREKLEGSNQTIMVVEDIKMNRMLVKEMIDRLIENYKLVEASNGKEAVEYFKKYRPIMIFMDIQMPVMDGYTATKLIRNIDKEVPIITLTAGAIKEEKDKSFEMGISDFITKPIQKDIFDRTFKKWFNYDGKINENIKDYYNDISSVNTANQLETALLNLGRDVKLYTRIAEEYMKESIKLLTEIRPSYEEKNKEHLYYIIHSIKGMASNVGLSQLAKMSGDLLKELNYGNDISNDKINLFEIKVHNSINSIETFIKNLDLETKNEINFSIEKIKEFIDTIKELLENSDFIEDNILETLESIKSNDKEINQQIKGLSDSIKIYNYEEAIFIINKINNIIKNKGEAYEKED
jgi:PAS domain S-box-containing protein